MILDRLKKLLRIQLGSVLLVVFGLLLLLKPDFGSAAVAAVAGWALVAAGVIGLLLGIFGRTVPGLMGLIGSGIVLCAGIYLLRNPLMLASALGVVLGLLLLSQGVGAFRDAARLRRCGGKHQLSLMLGIALCGSGAYLIVFPLTTSRLVMTVAGLVMTALGITELVSHYHASKFITSTREPGDPDQIIDAE